MDGEKTPRSRRSTTISFSSSATTTSPPDEHNVDKLKELLRQEAYSHKETGQCYSTLQKEYDDLLKKYAEAENTIDKLRIGARIKLYYDSPPPQQADNEVFQDMRSKSTQLLHLAQPQKVHLSRTYSMPERLLTKKRGLSSSLPAPSRVSEEDLVARLQCLQNDVTNFHTLLSDGECTLQEQREINEGLKDEFSMIKDEFKTLENNGSRNRAYSTNSKISEDFGGANSLQAEVYRLGLRLEEIDEEIGDQIRQQQQQQKPSTTTGNTGYEDNLLNGGCGDSSRSSSHPPNEAEKNSPKKCSPDSIRVSRQTDQRYAQTSIPPEANPEESGYYTGRSHPPVANSYTTGIESKYLSQSMKKNPPSAYSYETEDRVGSWVSKSHQSALNKSPISQSEQMKYSNSQSDRHSGHCKSQSESRRRTRSSDGSISLSSSNKLRLNNRRRRSQTQEETKIKNVDPNNNFDNDNIKKLSVTPENVRPFTHNSTEDSGFMDYRSHASRTQSQPQSPLRVWDGGSSVPENFPSPTSNSPTEGEQYRQRLDSLRNFVLAKRQGDGNTSGTARPRSWVRGKSPTNYSPSVASSRTKDRGTDRPSTLPVRPLSSTTHDHNNNTQHHPQREDQDMYNSNNNRLKKHIQQPRRSLHQTRDIERQSIVSGSSSTRDSDNCL
ncbi:micronuclear linker histone polyprotein-like [Clytia hemisphaerica]